MRVARGCEAGIIEDVIVDGVRRIDVRGSFEHFRISR
jgi:hypothetical protein